MDLGLANEKAADLLEAAFECRPVSNQAGKMRKLFASAITPLGYRNYLNNFNRTGRNSFTPSKANPVPENQPCLINWQLQPKKEALIARFFIVLLTPTKLNI